MCPFKINSLMKYLILVAICFSSIQINAQNSFTIIYKYKIDKILKDSFSFELVKPLGASLIGEGPFYQKKINKFQILDSLCEVSCSYNVSDTTCALIFEGFGHEIFAIPNDTIEIKVSPKRNSNNETPQFTQYDFAFSGKNSIIYGFFDQLELTEGSLQFSKIGINNSKNPIEEYFLKAKEQYLKRMNFLNAYFGEYKLPEIFKKFATSEITSTFYDNLYSITFLKEFKKNKYSGFPNGYLEMFDKTKFVDKDLYFKTRFYHNCAYSYFLYNAALNDSVNAFESDKGFRIAYKLIKENCSDNMKYDLLTHLLEWNVSKKLNTYDSLYHDFSSICFNEIYINYLDKVVAREQKKNKQKELLTEQIALKSKILSNKGKRTNIESILSKNKITILDCWASWCVPCLRQIPYVEKFQKEFKGKVEFIYLSFDHDSSQWRNKSLVIGNKIQSFLVDSNFKSDFAKYFEIYSIPRYIIFNKDGKVLTDNASRPANEKEFREMIQSLMNSN